MPNVNIFFFNESVLYIAQSSGDQLSVYRVYALVLEAPLLPKPFFFIIVNAISCRALLQCMKSARMQDNV